jgi:hypothetical protein
MRAKRCVCAALAVACALLTVQTAHAQFDAIAHGLYLAGFRPDWQRNPLTKGVDFSGTASYFTGQNVLHYGISTLTLDGNLTYDGYYAKRPIPSLSFGISSAGGRGQAPQPISYTLSIPRAAQSLTVTGTATIDTSFTVDETGWYHRVLKVNNTGTVKTDGLNNSEKNIDFTLGPIDQTGNIFLEGLQGLLGGASGTETTTAGSLSSVLAASKSSKFSQADIDALDVNDPEQLKAFVNAALVQGVTEAATDPSLGEQQDSGTNPVLVPEPATLILLALSGSIVMMGFRRHRAAA